MKKIFTQTDLIRLVYKETNPSETQQMLNSIDSDWELRTYYEELLEVKRCMNAIQYKPSSESLNAVIRQIRK
ncbi:MAG: hypothetical protein IIA45_01245 [Bacteroidetes bacterium]|nr:hypothetical protein [Bacteroidota bacterium]